MIKIKTLTYVDYSDFVEEVQSRAKLLYNEELDLFVCQLCDYLFIQMVANDSYTYVDLFNVKSNFDYNKQTDTEMYDLIRKEEELDIFNKIIVPLVKELGFDSDITFWVSW